MWFFLTEEEKRIRDIARKVAKEIAPLGREIEAKGEAFNWEAIRKLHKAGLLNLHVPKKYGGEGDRPVILFSWVKKLSFECNFRILRNNEGDYSEQRS